MVSGWILAVILPLMAGFLDLGRPTEGQDPPSYRNSRAPVLGWKVNPPGGAGVTRSQMDSAPVQADFNSPRNWAGGWTPEKTSLRRKRSLVASQRVQMNRRSTNQRVQNPNLMWNLPKRNDFGRKDERLFRDSSYQWPIDKQYQTIGRYPPSIGKAVGSFKTNRRRLTEYGPNAAFYQRSAAPAGRTINSASLENGSPNWNRQSSSVQSYPQLRTSGGDRPVFCPCTDDYGIVRVIRLAEGCVCPTNETQGMNTLSASSIPWRSNCRSRWSCKNRKPFRVTKALLSQYVDYGWNLPVAESRFVSSNRMKYSSPWNARQKRRNELYLNPIALQRPQGQQVIEVYPKFRTRTAIDREIEENRNRILGYSGEWEGPWINKETRRTLKRQVNAKKRTSIGGRRSNEQLNTNHQFRQLTEYPLSRRLSVEGDQKEQQTLMELVEDRFNLTEAEKDRRIPSKRFRDRKTLKAHKRPSEFNTLEAVEWAIQRCKKTKTGYVCPKTEMCTKNVCFNGGTCMNVPADYDDGFACLCQKDWLGKRCDLRKDRRRNLKGLQERSSEPDSERITEEKYENEHEDIRKQIVEGDDNEEKSREVEEKEEEQETVQTEQQETEQTERQNTTETEAALVNKMDRISQMVAMEELKSHKAPSFWDNISHFFKRKFHTNGYTAITPFCQNRLYFCVFICGVYYIFNYISQELGT